MATEKKNLLFVDDDENLLHGLRLMSHAKRREWRSHFATSGEEALPMLESISFDLVVADMRMPGMTGAEFLEQVQKKQPEAIRIVLSGYSDVQAMMQAVRPAHQFLSKPCDTKTLLENLERVFRIRSILTDKNVRGIVSRLEALPTLPQIYLAIVRELEKESPSLKFIGDLVERDVGTSATVLKLVNSSFFGFFNRITRPSQAVTLLGTDILQGVILGVKLLHEAQKTTKSVFSLEKLWEHSFRIGHFAKTIAEQETKDDELINACFIAGLLHDIGKLILVQNMNEEYKEVIEKVQQNGVTILEAERAVFKAGHPEVGAYLLGVWGMKESIVTAVNNHHALELEQIPEFNPSLALHAADAIEHELVKLNNYTYPGLNEEYIAKLGLTDRVPVWKEACQELLERGIKNE